MKRIIFRVLAIVFGLALAGVGGWMAAAGHAYGVSSGNPVRYEVPQARALVRETRALVRKLPREYRGYLNINETGMLYPLGGAGGLIFFVGMVIALNGAFRRFAAADKVAVAKSTRISDDLIPSARKESPAKKGGKVVSIDEGIIKDEDTEAEKLRDINYIVTISQGTLQPGTVELVVQTFRPDLEEYMPLFNAEGAEMFAHQILDNVILRHRRHSEEITADQFQAQDIRITECERETVCHRYMPPRAKISSPEIRELVGKVYDPYNRSVVQKEVSGEADDWRDVSLRNAAEVLSAKTALDTAA